METLFIYFIKVSVLVTLFYMAYWLLLKKETFFEKNRMFLLLGLVTALVLPLITVTKTIWVEPEPIVFNEPVFVPFEEFQPEVISQITEEKTEINWSYIVAGLYLLGVLFFLSKFVLSSLSLYKILHKTPIKKLNGYKIIDSKKVKIPFSFFSYIAFDSSAFSEEELQNIITHEKVHSNQKHSLDVLLSELFLIVFWLNPFVWLYRKAMLQNLEFIADSKAIKTSENRVIYQKTLLKITLNPESLALANPFYQPLIKKRIMMLNKMQSKKSQLWKYLVVLPLLALFVVQFQTKVVAQTKENETFKPTTNQEQISVSIDTIVWVKDFANSYENPDEWVKYEEWVEDFEEGYNKENSSEEIKKSTIDIRKKKPLIIINGEELTSVKFENAENISFSTSGSFTLLDEKEGFKKYGEKGKNGVVVIKGENVKLTPKYPEEKELLSFLKSAKDFKEIFIFNRWGVLVYNFKSSEKLDEEKIKSLPSGTYFYQIKKSNEEPQTGYVFIEETSQNTKQTNSLSDFIKQIDKNEYIEIYDRWGTIVYKPLLNEKFSPNQLSELPVGTYFYIQKDKTGYFYISEKDSKISLSTNDEKRAKGKEIEQKLKSKFRENHLNEKEDFLKEKEQELQERERQAQENSTLSEEEKSQRIKEREKQIKEKQTKLQSLKVDSKEYNKTIDEINELSDKIHEKAMKLHDKAMEEHDKAMLNHDKAMEEHYKTMEKHKLIQEKEKLKIDQYKIDLNVTNSVSATINKNTTDKEIKEYIAQFKSQNIEMKVSNIKRNKNGEITKIKISLTESSGTSNNKKESKAEATFERNEAIPEIFIGKRNGNLIVSSDKK